MGFWFFLINKILKKRYVLLMPFSVMGLAAREGLEHLGYREAKYQHWQGFAAPFVFSQRPAPCRARFSSSWRHWCDPAVREGLCSAWLFWELLERFEVFLFGWFCIACFVLFWVFVCFFFPWNERSCFEYSSYFTWTSSFQVFLESMAVLACISG